MPFIKPILPVVPQRQLPQHPKMSLAYILNPANPAPAPSPPSLPDAKITHVLPEVPSVVLGFPSHPLTILPSEKSNSRSLSPSLSDNKALTSGPGSPGFLAALFQNALSNTSHSYHHSSVPVLLSKNSFNSSASSSDVEDSIPTIPDVFFDSSPSSLSNNSTYQIDPGSDSTLSGASPMGQRQSESPTSKDPGGIRLSSEPISLSWLRVHVPRSAVASADTNRENPGVNLKPTPAGTRRQLPQHPKMRLSYILNQPDPVAPKQQHALK